jgi:hypothetical protein
MPPSLLRWLRLAWALVALVAIVVPAALGPATGVVLRRLGAEMTHVCKCGMKAGTCGCPECARLERDAHRSASAPAWKRECDDDEPAFASALPDAVVPAGSSAAPAFFVVAPPRTDFGLPLVHPEDEPPTPPPRIALA